MVEFTVGCPERKDLFELGKGAWGWHYPRASEWNFDASYDPSIKRLLDDALHRDDREAFARYVVRVWNLGYHVEPGHNEWVRDVGRRLFDYCQERDWKVVFICDCDDEYDSHHWTVVDSRYR